MLYFFNIKFLTSLFPRPPCIVHMYLHTNISMNTHMFIKSIIIEYFLSRSEGHTYIKKHIHICTYLNPLSLHTFYLVIFTKLKSRNLLSMPYIFVLRYK